eukprot:1284273-Amphidinium_carterae.2
MADLSHSTGPAGQESGRAEDQAAGVGVIFDPHAGDVEHRGGKHSLPETEQTRRITALGNPLNNIQVIGEYEPSTTLVNRAYSSRPYTMVQTLRVIYIPWSSCLSKLGELRGLSTAVLGPQEVEWVAD